MEPSFRNETINGTYIALQIFDIAGQKSFKQLREMFYRGSRGGIITFDLTRKETLDSVLEWHNEVNHKVKGGKYILVGNKNDLVDDREVKKSDVDKIMKKIDFIEYIETSALTGEHVKEAFHTLASVILKDNIARFG